MITAQDIREKTFEKYGDRIIEFLKSYLDAQK